MKTTLTVILIIQLYGLTFCITKQHYFINLEKTWDDAQQYCRNYFHDLSTFTSETEEQQFLEDATVQTSDSWIGLHKESGIWKWIGGEVAAQISWGDNQPEKDDCVYIKDENNNNDNNSGENSNNGENNTNSKESNNGDGKEGDGKEGDGKGGDGKGGDGKGKGGDGKGKGGDGKEGDSKGKGGDGKGGDDKGGDGKGGDGKGKEGDGKGGDGKGKGGDGKEGDGKGKEGDGKAGDGKGGDGKEGDGKGKEGEGKGGDGKGKGGDGKGGDGKGGDGKGSDGKGGDGKEGDGKEGDGKGGDGEGKEGEGKEGDGNSKEGDGNDNDSNNGNKNNNDNNSSNSNNNNNNNQRLHQKDCTNTFTFFCMRVFEIVVVQQTETWETALDYCRDHYDDLASLSTNRTMDYALNQITEAQTQYIWIGLRFLAGQWFWVNEDDLEYKAWSEAGLPQCPATNQRCGALDINTKTWTFRDCEEKLNFLCF